MEEEVYLIDIVARLDARSSWMLVFLSGIWVGLIVVNINLAQIRSQLQTLNQRTRGSDDGFRPDLTLDDSKKPYIGKPVRFDGKGPFKYCVECSSPTPIFKMVCQTCNGALFVHKKPDAQK